jgi:hypothetical protein
MRTLKKTKNSWSPEERDLLDDLTLEPWREVGWPEGLHGRDGIPFFGLCKLMGKRDDNMEFLLEYKPKNQVVVCVNNEQESHISLWTHSPNLGWLVVERNGTTSLRLGGMSLVCSQSIYFIKQFFFMLYYIH